MAVAEKKKHVKILPVIAAGAVGLAAAGRCILIRQRFGQTGSLREYTVSRGDITVGTAESGTVTLGREYATFPCSGEVLETAVKEGQQVKEGDLLFRISPVDIESYTSELKSKRDNALAELSEAEMRRENGTVTARQTLETSLEKGEQARQEYELSGARQEYSASQSQGQLEKYSSELEEVNALSETYPGDRAALDEMEERLEVLEAEREEISGQYEASREKDEENAAALEELRQEYSDYNEDTSELWETVTELKTAYEKAEEKYNAAAETFNRLRDEADTDQYVKSSGENSSGSTGSSQWQSSQSGQTSQTDQSTQTAQSNQTTGVKTLSQAQEEMNEAYNDYGSAMRAYLAYEKREEKITDTKEAYEEKIKQRERDNKAHENETNALKKQLDSKDREIEKYRSDFNGVQQDFTDKYGQSDADSLASRREELESSIAKAELDIAGNEAEESEKQLEAEHTMSTSLHEAQTAQQVYDSTVAALDRQVEECRRQYEQAEKSYEEFLENTADGGAVYAECSGIISSVSVSEGDDIAAGMPLVTIMDMSEIYLTTAVSEEDISMVTDGQECSVTLTAFEDSSFEGYVYTVSPEPARSSGSVSYTVTVKLEAEGINVREGMSGEITFLEGQVQDVLMVNVNAVTFRDGVSYVKMYGGDGSLEERSVETGFTDGRYVEICSGVVAGDRLIVETALSGSGEESARNAGGEGFPAGRPEGGFPGAEQ